MRGASLVELLVAMAIVLAGAGLAARVVIEASDAFAWQPVASELSQRAEALAQLLTADLTAAGAGPRARPAPGDGSPEPLRLRAWLPAILPRLVALDGGDADDTAAEDRLSILTIADGAAQAVVRRLPPRWGFVPGPTCPAPVDGCGFSDGLPVLWLEARPGFQLGDADTVDASGLGVTGITATADDAVVAAVEVVSYRFDRVRGELLRGRAGGRGLPVAGHVTGFAVEWWGDAEPPAGPSWTPGLETCVTLADGRPRLPPLAPPGAPPIRLDVARLTDGPWCGTPPFRFDADLFRVRRVRVRLGLAADTDAGGSRGSPAREVRGIELAIDVAPPALRGPA
jgi:type II secretory pathway pseudopilin PulG